MKLISSLTLAMALLVPLAVSAASFEGVVKLTMKASSDKSIPLELSLKNGLSRMEMSAEGHTMVMITDPAKQQMTMVMPEQQMYMVHSIAVRPKKGQKMETDDTTIEQTNEHEKILGYDTTKYIAKSKDVVTQIWATEDLGTFFNFGGSPMGGTMNGGEMPAWANALKGKNIFPLRLVSNNAKGKEEFRLDVTDITKKSLPDSLFTPPDGYRKLDMGGMMGGMGMPGRPAQD